MSSEFKRVFSNAPWEAKVGYCRAIRAGNIIAVTGTTSISTDGQVVGTNDPYMQAKHCLELTERAITDLGASRTNIIRTRLFVTNIKLWQEFGRAHGEFFEGCPPTTSMIEVKGLIDPHMLIEIEADAVIA
jgi:enamine deaminase RidA (YjgF/YER057c/UK114 family)